MDEDAEKGLEYHGIGGDPSRQVLQLQSKVMYNSLHDSLQFLQCGDIGGGGERVRYIHVLRVAYLLCISSTAPRALFPSDL